ncbi:MAG: RNA polymerase sigma factor [Ruminococcus sp.]|nr:RNA polymerase sigma factor [Ruminococcus sp.]
MGDSKRLFEEIYNSTKENTYRYIAAKCYNIDDVDDIYQNTYISVYNALEKRDSPPENNEAFVILIAKRELFKYYGLVKRITSHFGSRSGIDDDYKEDADTFDLEDSVVSKALLEEISALLKSKDITTQKIFFLYYYEGCTLGETASLLEMSESSVKRRLYGTLSQIRRLYGKE